MGEIEESKGISKLQSIYQKNRFVLENIVFPVLLILYPLLKIRQGIDVSDTTYSLSNFQYFTSMDGTWIVATFLSNVVGWLMMSLPFGATLMGMYFYTALVQSATAVIVYRVFSKSVPALPVFVGEVIALGLCWCPSTILYNYLTYLLMAAGMMLLYKGIICENCRYYVAAGVCLGMNVAVRMPNVVQMAFIVAVWYGAFLFGGKWRRAVTDTLWCILGYVIGFGMPFGVICIRYGTGAYPSMVMNLFAMTEKATDYKPSSMVAGMFGDYFKGLHWLIFAGICMLGGWVLFVLQRKVFADKRWAVIFCKVIYGAVLLVLLRFYWGRGVFNFQYYEDGSVYYPAVLLLIVTVLMAVLCLCKKRMPGECKIMAVLVLVQILVTPLGSNNYLYPIINNMFVAVPFALWIGYLWDRKQQAEGMATENGVIEKGQIEGAVTEEGVTEERQAEGATTEECITEKRQVKDVATEEDVTEKRAVDWFGAYRTVWIMPFCMLVIFVLVQSVGFHLHFSFRDGVEGEKRDTTVSAPVKAAGVYTTKDNAAWLSELAEYTDSVGLAGKEVILYGEIPGLGYFLDMPPALSTFWPDLDSYRMVEYERDMDGLESPPVIITSSPIAAWLNEDADGMNWFGVDQEKLNADEKLQILSQYMEERGYQESFGNGRYVVYVTGE